MIMLRHFVLLKNQHSHQTDSVKTFQNVQFKSTKRILEHADVSGIQESNGDKMTKWSEMH